MEKRIYLLVYVMFVFCFANAQQDSGCYLTSPSKAFSVDFYGYDFDFSKDIAIVGSPGLTDHLDVDSNGAAYIYMFENNIWQLQKICRTNNDQPSRNFGISVVVDGNTIALGELFVDSLRKSRGAVHIYNRSDGDWNFSQTIKASRFSGENRFGYRLAISDNSLLISNQTKLNYQISNSEESPTKIGSIYTKGANGNWIKAQDLVSNSIVLGSYKPSLDLNRKFAIIGNPRNSSKLHDGKTHTYVGSVIIFKKNLKNEWNEFQSIQGPELLSHERFGQFISLHGRLLIVGSSSNDQHGLAGNNSPEKRYLYKRRFGGKWKLIHTFYETRGPLSIRFHNNVEVY